MILFVIENDFNQLYVVTEIQLGEKKGRSKGQRCVSNKEGKCHCYGLCLALHSNFQRKTMNAFSNNEK